MSPDLNLPPVEVHTSSSVPAWLLPLLKDHLPQSLPLLRRLEFTQFHGGVTKHARILYCSSGPNTQAEAQIAEDESEERRPLTPWAAAYLDLSRGPETELWMYASLESDPSPSQSAAGDTALAIFREVKRQRELYDAAGAQEEDTGEEEEEDKRLFPRTHYSTILVGTLSEKVRVEMVNRGCVFPYVEGHDKWLMSLKGHMGEEIGPMETGRGDPDKLVDGQEKFRWAELRTRKELEFVLGRSKIPRKVRTMKLLPNKAITLEDGTPIAWCFLGPDSSLTSLHCEEAYRGRGFAKAVAVKVLQDHLQDYGDDGWACADVAPNNPSSQWVCRSLKARVAWTMSWSRIDLDQSFPST